MRIHTIWNDFKNVCKQEISNAYKGVKTVFRDTFETLKGIIITLITGLASYVYNLIVSLYKVIKAPIHIIFSALWLSVKATFGIWIKKTINWIRKW